MLVIRCVSSVRQSSSDTLTIVPSETFPAAFMSFVFLTVFPLTVQNIKTLLVLIYFLFSYDLGFWIDYLDGRVL